MTFRKILFPVDFSEACESTVPYIRAVCGRFQASLTLAHFVYIPMAAAGSIDAPIPIALPVAELIEDAEQRLSAFSARVFPDLNPGILVSDGDPAAGIVDLAASSETDLIMMPTHGRGRFRALLLGSATAKTLHDARCAVWTAVHSHKQPANTDWQKIVCAVDRDEEGISLIRKAAELNADGKAQVCLVHAVPPSMSARDLASSPEYAGFLVNDAVNALSRMQATAGTSFKVRVRPGVVPKVVAEAAFDCSADLVLIGRGVLPRFAGQLRSHAYSIVREVPCPVLSC